MLFDSRKKHTHTTEDRKKKKKRKQQCLVDAEILDYLDFWIFGH